MPHPSRKSTPKKKAATKPVRSGTNKIKQPVIQVTAKVPKRTNAYDRSYWTRLRTMVYGLIQKEAPLEQPKRAANGARKLKEPRYASFKMSKHIKIPHAPVPNSFRLLRIGLRTLGRHWYIFCGITLVYLAISLLLVKGLGNAVDVGSVRDAVQTAISGNWGKIASGFVVLSSLVSNDANPASAAAGAYQTMLIVVFSLAYIWALRQLLAKEKIGLRDVFYKGMYPLIPFLLVVLVIAIQLLPSVVASYLYNLAFVQGLAVNLIEKILWGLLLTMLLLWTIYMVMSSVLALYIVTLPDMRPMQALRSARELVRFRRWSVLRKLLFLPLGLLVLIILIMLPVIWLIPSVAEWVFFVLELGSVGIAHAYMYIFYRELLK